MKVLVVQNSALGTFGAFGDAIERRYRASIKTIRPDHLSFDTVDSYDADLFVLLGSRRGVYETDVSWIAQEADFAKRLIRDGSSASGHLLWCANNRYCARRTRLADRAPPRWLANKRYRGQTDLGRRMVSLAPR
jgi:hypothetical protein